MKKSEFKNIVSEEIRVALISEMDPDISIEDQAKIYWLQKLNRGEIDKLPNNPKEAFLHQMMKDQMSHDEETLRRERGMEEVTSQKQKQWACAQINSKNRSKGLSKAQAEEMCRSQVKEEILKVLRKK